MLSTSNLSIFKAQNVRFTLGLKFSIGLGFTSLCIEMSLPKCSDLEEALYFHFALEMVYTCFWEMRNRPAQLLRERTAIREAMIPRRVKKCETNKTWNHIRTTPGISSSSVRTSSFLLLNPPFHPHSCHHP